MPLLQSIVQELDAELTRLQALRKIVAGLAHTPAMIRRLAEADPRPIALLPSAKGLKATTPTPTVALPSSSSLAVQPARRLRTDRGIRRGPKVPKPTEEARALAGTIPSGPVVFYPGRVVQTALSEPAAEMEQGYESTPALDPVDLDAESRQLAARWAAGSTL